MFEIFMNRLEIYYSDSSRLFVQFGASHFLVRRPGHSVLDKAGPECRPDGTPMPKLPNSAMLMLTGPQRLLPTQMLTATGCCNAVSSTLMLRFCVLHPDVAMLLHPNQSNGEWLRKPLEPLIVDFWAL